MRFSAIISQRLLWVLITVTTALSGQDGQLTERVTTLVTDHIESGLAAAGFRGEVVSVSLPVNAANVLSDAALTIPREYVPRKAAGRQVIKVVASSTGHPRTLLNVTTATVAIIDGWVTNYPVKRGDGLDPIAFTKKTIRTETRESDYIQEATLPTNRQFSKSLKPGELLKHHHLEVVPDVESGDDIMIYFKRSSITLVSPGKARRNAQIGERLPVIADATGKRFYGRLESPGVVIVEKR